jgi:hypothetical protein
VAAVAALAGRAWADAAADQREAIAQAKDTGYGWLMVVVAIVLVAGLVVVSFLSSRRTHQD